MWQNGLDNMVKFRKLREKSVMAVTIATTKAEMYKALGRVWPHLSAYPYGPWQLHVQGSLLRAHTG